MLMLVEFTTEGKEVKVQKSCSLFTANYTKNAGVSLHYFVHTILTNTSFAVKDIDIHINGIQLMLGHNIHIATLAVTKELTKEMSQKPQVITVDKVPSAPLTTEVAIDVPFPEISVGAKIVIGGVKRHVTKVISRNAATTKVVVW